MYNMRGKTKSHFTETPLTTRVLTRMLTVDARCTMHAAKDWPWIQLSGLSSTVACDLRADAASPSLESEERRTPSMHPVERRAPSMAR